MTRLPHLGQAKPFIAMLIGSLPLW